MNNLNLIPILLFSLFAGSAAKGQQLSWYELRSSVSQLPSCGFKTEIYSKDKSSTAHYLKVRNYRQCSRIVRSTLPANPNIPAAIVALDSLFRLQRFTLPVDRALVADMKKDTALKTYYRVSDNDIDNFFNGSSVFHISLSDVLPDSTDEEELADGNYYSFVLKAKRAGKDTVRYIFSDNRIRSGEIKNWLPFYILNKKYTLFMAIKSVAGFLGDRAFRDVLFRFISWKKSSTM